MNPDDILNLLEREPIVYFGCTWSEIMSAAVSSFIKAFLGTLVLLILPLPFNKILLILVLVLVWLFLTSRSMSNLRKLRDGKPLHYEKHHKMMKRFNDFVSLDELKQNERNNFYK